MVPFSLLADNLYSPGSSSENKVLYGVENSTTFLECSPKSQRAAIYWQVQKHNEERKHEVGSQEGMFGNYQGLEKVEDTTRNPKGI